MSLDEFIASHKIPQVNYIAGCAIDEKSKLRKKYEFIREITSEDNILTRSSSAELFECYKQLSWQKLELEQRYRSLDFIFPLIALIVGSIAAFWLDLESKNPVQWIYWLSSLVAFIIPVSLITSRKRQEICNLEDWLELLKESLEYGRKRDKS